MTRQQVFACIAAIGNRYKKQAAVMNNPKKTSEPVFDGKNPSDLAAFGAEIKNI